MAKGGSESAGLELARQETLVNTGAPWPMLSAEEAEARVLGIQAKLHRWAIDDPERRFGDLFNLVCDPAFLLVGWRRVRGNRGARSAGVDGQTAHYVERLRGEAAFLASLRADLKARRFVPLPVRERRAAGRLEVQATGGSSPDNVAEAWHCQTRRPRKQDGKG